MNKYIIKNCPAISFAGGCKNREVKVWDCQDCTDCILKRIVELCNEYSDKWEDCDFSNGLSDEIFELLDIQECE